jgi:hypothetical protein
MRYLQGTASRINALLECASTGWRGLTTADERSEMKELCEN